MKVTQMPPVHAANLVANSGNTAYGVDMIASDCLLGGLFTHLFVLWNFTYKPHEFRVLFTSLWKRHQPLPIWGWEFFWVFFKGGGHLRPCGWGGGSLNLFKWHHYGCLNNPISSNLALCTACCCSINSSSGLTRGKPDQKTTILVFRLVLQNFAHPAFFPCILCYPNLIISPYFLLVVLLLQYVALSISVQGTSYVLVVINWCRVAISNDKSTSCALTFLFFFHDIGCDLSIVCYLCYQYML